MNQEQKEWRAFEKLIGRIESTLVPLGATVKGAGKHLRDEVTGELREVDGVIQYTDASGEKRITLECRRRSEKQDSTWIEQLVTKKKDINATDTIAISFTGLSDAAVKKALHHGIHLRELDVITP